MSTFHAILSVKSNGVVFKKNFNLFVFVHPTSHHVACAEIRLANNHINLLTQLSQIQGFLTCRITTANYGYGLLAIEETVAGGTCRNALAIVFLLIIQSQILGAGSRGNDNTISLYFYPSVRSDDIRFVGEVNLHDDSVSNVCTESFGLLLQVHHHLVAINTFGITREVFHDCGLRELTTHLQTTI